jgi:ABC-2 type transport system ATP-binding protein
MIEVENLTKNYANHAAVNGISFTVGRGEVVGFLGPNGAGKSTIIGIISTLVRPSSGNVSVYGRDVATHVYETKLDFGVVPQEVNFNPFEKVADIVMTQAGYYGLPRGLARERTEKYLRKLGLWDKRDTRSRTLSGGMKRRLMIARALVHEPRLLILDEPTAGVDIELRRSMWDFLQEINNNGTTIILTTHYLEEAEQLCRNIAIIDQGRIIENCNMKSLLNMLDSQTLVCDLRNELSESAFAAAALARFRYIDGHTMEIDLGRDQDVNEIFAILNAANIQVKGMRSKSNRLEQLFLSRLKNSAT